MLFDYENQKKMINMRGRNKEKHVSERRKTKEMYANSFF